MSKKNTRMSIVLLMAFLSTILATLFLSACSDKEQEQKKAYLEKFNGFWSSKIDKSENIFDINLKKKHLYSILGEFPACTFTTRIDKMLIEDFIVRGDVLTITGQWLATKRGKDDFIPYPAYQQQIFHFHLSKNQKILTDVSDANDYLAYNLMKWRCCAEHCHPDET